MNLHILQILGNLAQQNSSAAALALAKEIEAHRQGLEKITLLTDYLQDYRVKLETQMLRGLKVSQLINSQNFMQQIEVAIKQQEKSVAHIETQVDLARQHWRECERKLVTFSTLTKRTVAQAALHEAKIDQKNTDEFAARKLSVRFL